VVEEYCVSFLVSTLLLKSWSRCADDWVAMASKLGVVMQSALLAQTTRSSTVRVYHPEDRTVDIWIQEKHKSPFQKVGGGLKATRSRWEKGAGWTGSL